MYVRSNAPWCVGPSAPTSPARSRQKTTWAQTDVDHGLVEGALHERGVDCDEGHLAGKRERACHGDGVFLGDPDIAEALGVGLRELLETRSICHCRGDGDDFGVLRAELDELVAEDRRPARVAALQGDLARLDVEGPHAMEGVGVALCRSIALALGRDGVHHDRPLHLGGIVQDVFQGGDVMPVDRADVGDAEALEELGPRQDERFERFLHGVAGVHEGPAQTATARVERLLDGVAHHRVRVRHARLCEVAREPAHVGRDGHAVVVEHDDHVRMGVPDVVEGLERHAARKRGVADERGDSRVASIEVTCIGVAKRRRQRVRCVTRVVRVVFAFGNLGKT